MLQCAGGEVPSEAKRKALTDGKDDSDISKHHIGILITCYCDNEHTFKKTCLLGTFRVSISAMKMPPPNLQVRDVKEWYVDFLTESMQDDNEDLSSPFLVICSVSKEEFRPECLASYSYDVKLKYTLCTINAINSLLVTKYCNIVGEFLQLSHSET